MSSALQTDKLYDLLGSTTFIILAAGTLAYGDCARAGAHIARPAIATALVCIWALRLGGFLVLRVLKTGSDSRFNEAKKKPGACSLSSICYSRSEPLKVAVDRLVSTHRHFPGILDTAGRVGVGHATSGLDPQQQRPEICRRGLSLRTKLAGRGARSRMHPGRPLQTACSVKRNPCRASARV